MLRKLGLLGLIICVTLVTLVGAGLAQEGDNPVATYELNMRTGPGTTYPTTTIIPAGTPLALEARSADLAWVLAQTSDGATRGWVASLYLTYPEGYVVARLPVSEEIVGSPPPAAPVDSGSAAPPPADGVSAYAVYDLNLRSGPGTGYSALGVVPANTGLVLEARNADASWVLARTPDGSKRGWLASLYLKFTAVSASSLPYSEETVAAPAPAAPVGPFAPATGGSYEGIIMGPFDPATVAGIDLTAYPTVGRSTGRARAIFLEGRAKGNNPHGVSAVGDCSSEHWYFLKPFGWGQYNLGAYSNLQPVIDHFSESLAHESQATSNGFNANAVMVDGWGNPAVCQPDESPLGCEFRTSKPAVAIIMFGTSDLIVMSAYEFDFYLREIVRLTIENGTIPILSTFPSNLAFPNHTILYNQIVVKVALDNDIPLINLWLALESLPNHGVEADGFHLGEQPNDNSCYLTEDYLRYGYPVRNLVTLRTLDNVWRGAMQ